MSQNDLLQDAIESIYVALLTPVPVEIMLNRVVRYMDARKAAIIQVHSDGLHSSSFHSVQYDPFAWKVYNSEDCIDPRARSAKTAKQGDILMGQKSVPNHSILKTFYYSEIQFRHDVMDTMSGIISSPLSTKKLSVKPSTISVAKGFNQDFFDEKDAAKLKLLMPHFENAQAIAQTFKEISIAREIGQSNNDKLVLLVQKNMTFEPMGSNWQSAWDEIGIFSTAHGMLQTNSLTLQSKLQKLVSEAVSLKIGGSLTFNGKSGQEYTARLAPIPDEIHHLFYFSEDHFAILEISLTDPKHPPEIDKFKTIYQLSSKEAQVLSVFSRSFNLRVTASTLGMQYETARWHFKRILEKTQMKNQAELMYKLASIQAG